MKETDPLDKIQSIKWIKNNLVRMQSYEAASFCRDWEKILIEEVYPKRSTYDDLTIPQIEFIPFALYMLELKFPKHKSILETRKKFSEEFKIVIREQRLNDILK